MSYRILSALITIFLSCGICRSQGGVSYRAMAPYPGGYLLCGLGEHVDLIGDAGELVRSFPLGRDLNLRDMAVISDTAVAVGDDGVLVIVEDGQTFISEFPGMDFGAIASFRGHFFIASSNSLLVADKSLDVQSAIVGLVRGKIISLSAYGDESICAVSDEAEFIWSQDGENWAVCRFNEEYAGYYPEIRPVAVAAGSAQYALAAIGPDGNTVLFLSPGGSVWSGRNLDYSTRDGRYVLESEVRNVVFDAFNDRFALLCSDGEVFFVPGCSHCNSLEKTRAGNLYDAHPVPGSLLVAGDDSFFGVLR